MVKLSGKLIFSNEAQRKKPIPDRYQPHFHLPDGLYSGVIELLYLPSLLPGETALANVEIPHSAVTAAEFAPDQFVESGEADRLVGVFVVTRVISG
jgi:hypothetical protein